MIKECIIDSIYGIKLPGKVVNPGVPVELSGNEILALLKKNGVAVYEIVEDKRITLNIDNYLSENFVNDKESEEDEVQDKESDEDEVQEDETQDKEPEAEVDNTVTQEESIKEAEVKEDSKSEVKKNDYHPKKKK
jgi:hypothetical protein